jgi:ERCC4 domain
MREFVVARNPEEGSTLPYLVRLPLPDGAVVLKVRDVWPRTAKVYCHRAAEWPDNPDIVERVAVRVCQRRGAAVDLVLDRGRENRSQFVFTKARGRDVIFWQSARTTRQARPNVTLPTARAAGQQLEIIIDAHERYPWNFGHQQATTRRRALPAGDYAVEADGAIVAAVERKSLADLVATILGGKLRYLLADLAALPQAAIVVADRYSAVFKLEHARPATIADAIGEAAARFPAVPIVFAETRPLAQEWTYRFLGTAAAHHHDHQFAESLAAQLAPAGPIAPAEPTTAEVRTWARQPGLDVPDRGRLRPDVWNAYRAEHIMSEYHDR